MVAICFAWGKGEVGMTIGIRAAVLALPVILFSAQAEAWWDAGHMTVAAVAWPLLKPEVQKRVGELLKLNSDYDTWTAGAAEADKDHVAFVHAATWADDIKKSGSG